MEELRFHVLVDPNLGPEIEGVVALGDFKSPKGTTIIFPDNCLPTFYGDLLMGRPFPLTLVTRKIDSVGKVLTLALFLHRDLAIHPKMASLVAAGSLVDQLQLAGLAHIDPTLARFFQFLMSYLPPSLSQTDLQIRLVTVVSWIRDYLLEDRFPALPPAPPAPRILDTGTNGFVLAECDGSLEDGWIELYRQGYLRGLLFGPDRKGRRRVLAARKSPFLALDLRKAAEILNEAENAMGEPSGWVTDGIWLEGPPEGTCLLMSAVTQVMIRV
jgi:hypothetical protein